MVDDKRQVMRKQSQVEVVHHRAGSRNPEVALEVRVVVPAQGGNAIARLNARLDQDLGQRKRAPVEVAELVAVQRLVGQAADDLYVRVIPPRTIQEVVQREGRTHHR
jgi:hypothetical protein